LERRVSYIRLSSTSRPALDFAIREQCKPSKLVVFTRVVKIGKQVFKHELGCEWICHVALQHETGDLPYSYRKWISSSNWSLAVVFIHSNMESHGHAKPPHSRRFFRFMAQPWNVLQPCDVLPSGATLPITVNNG
jgi:hypothetical protein